MSFPRIPGYTSSTGTRLSTIWNRPAGDYPAALWPHARLADIDANPSGWLVVEEHVSAPHGRGGRGCVLVEAGNEAVALTDTVWIGRDLGDFGVWSSGSASGYNNGLTDNRDGVATEFFVQARTASGATLPQIEIAHPFLWFWDAFEVTNGWRYVSAAGREHELIQYERSHDTWTVEVRVLEFRTFLKAYERSAILQIDYVTTSPEGDFERVDEDFHNSWAHIDFHADADFLTSMSQSSMSRLLGQYAFTGQRTARQPKWEEFQATADYPSFIFGTDSDTGDDLTHSCDPDELGTYFAKDDSRLHYLTPIYFKREVLQDYVAEPSRYLVTPFRISCLELWSVDISVNSIGLVRGVPW